MSRKIVTAGWIGLVLAALLITVPAWAGDTGVGVVSREDYEFIKNGGKKDSRTPLPALDRAPVVSAQDEAFVRNGGAPGNVTPLYGNASAGKVSEADYDFVTRDGKIMPAFAAPQWWISRK